jgi:hypothetical protein
MGRGPVALSLLFWVGWAAVRAWAPRPASEAVEACPLLPLLGFAGLGILLTEIGLQVLGLLRVRPGSPCSRWAFGFLLGCTALSFGCFGLAALQQLRAPVLLGTVIGAGLLLTAGAPRRGSIGSPLAQLRADLRRPSAVARGLAIMSGLFVLFGLMGSLAPTVDNDSLSYHLGAPALFVHHGGLVYVPTNLWTNTPLFAEMVYAVGLAVMGQTLARLFVFGWYVSVIVGAYELCRAHVARRHALVAAAILASTPVVAILTSTALNDGALLAYELGALYALCSFWRSGRPGWLALATVLAGSAASVKYYGWLVLVIVIGGGAMRALRREGMRGWLRWGPACMALGVALPGTWLLRNYVNTGNPVHPMLFSVFGSETWDGGLVQGYQAHMQSFGLRHEGWVGLVKAPVMATLDNDRFGSAIGIGPLFLILSPLAIVGAAGAPRRWWFFVGTSLALYVFWGLTYQALRFLLPGLAMWTLVVVGAMGRIDGRYPAASRLIQLVVLVGVALNWAWFVRVQDQMFRPYTGLFGAASRRAYIAQRVASYRSIEYANQRLASGAKLLFVGEWRTFYTQVPFAADTGPDPTLICGYVDSSRSVEEIQRRLRTDGFTHVLYSPDGLDLLEREFGYLRFASPEKRLLYSRLRASLELVNIQNGVSVYAVPQPRFGVHARSSAGNSDEADPAARRADQGGRDLQPVRVGEQRGPVLPPG